MAVYCFFCLFYDLVCFFVSLPAEIGLVLLHYGLDGQLLVLLVLAQDRLDYLLVFFVFNPFIDPHQQVGPKPRVFRLCVILPHDGFFYLVLERVLVIRLVYVVVHVWVEPLSVVGIRQVLQVVDDLVDFKSLPLVLLGLFVHVDPLLIQMSVLQLFLYVPERAAQLLLVRVPAAVVQRVLRVLCAKFPSCLDGYVNGAARVQALGGLRPLLEGHLPDCLKVLVLHLQLLEVVVEIPQRLALDFGHLDGLEYSPGWPKEK